MKTYNQCRCCGNLNLTPWLSLPDSPVANALFYEPNYDKSPLELNYCSSCGHLQLAGAPDPNTIFSSYRYKSSGSSDINKHFENYAEKISSKYEYVRTVLDIGSNDGYLLKQFKNKNYTVYGVEPSGYLKRDHLQDRVPVYTDFFSTKLVDNNEWREYFDVICANNVLALIPDIHDAMQGITMSLKPNGILVAECARRDGIISGQYLDVICHEHIDYYSPYSFALLCEKYGLVVEEIEMINNYNIGFRAYVRKKSGKHEIAEEFINIDAIENIIDSIASKQLRMKELIGNRKYTLYGAHVKAVTALYTLDIVGENLVGVVDDNELIQGCYFPGTNLMITQPENMDTETLVLVATQNVYEDIKQKLLEHGHTGEIICIQ